MKHRLWYKTPTDTYIEGLPVGNGRMAAMMLGGPDCTRIALNHEWMWRGENRFREYPDMSKHLPKVREALLQGAFLKGTELANKYFGGMSKTLYTPTGSLSKAFMYVIIMFAVNCGLLFIFT